MDRHLCLGGVYIEMIVNASRVDEIVKGEHVRCELEKELHRADSFLNLVCYSLCQHPWQT